MGFKIKSVVGSHLGAIRSNHEDNFLLNGQFFLSQQKVQEMNAQERKVWIEENICLDTNRLICAIADGMGGYQAGEIASLVTVQLLKQSQNTIVQSPNLQQAINHYQAFLNLLNEHVLKLSNSNAIYNEMGSTLTTLLIHDGQAIMISLGDSPGFVFSPIVGLTKLTVEQTYGQTLLSRREILPSQLEERPDYKHLTRYIGMEQLAGKFEGHTSPIIDIGEGKLFVLCSDGVTDHLMNEEIEKILRRNDTSRSWQAAVEEIVLLAVDKGGYDNISVMLVEVLPHDASKEVKEN